MDLSIPHPQFYFILGVLFNLVNYKKNSFGASLIKAYEVNITKNLENPRVIINHSEA